MIKTTPAASNKQGCDQEGGELEDASRDEEVAKTPKKKGKLKKKNYGRRESNPRPTLGKRRCCHYTTTVQNTNKLSVIIQYILCDNYRVNDVLCV